MDITPLLSNNALSMRRSQIRDLLSVATRPEIISFAGGFPNPETFPLEQLKGIMQDVLDQEGNAALQYGSTEGVLTLRQEIFRDPALSCSEYTSPSSRYSLYRTSRIGAFRFLTPETDRLFRKTARFPARRGICRR